MKLMQLHQSNVQHKEGTVHLALSQSLLRIMNLNVSRAFYSDFLLMKMTVI